MAESGKKNKYTAAVFALFFGWTGAHQFYLGKSGKGMLYAGAFLLGWFMPIFFILRWIPILLGLIDAVSLLFMSEKAFDRKYNSDETESKRERKRTRRYERHRKPDFERPVVQGERKRESSNKIRQKRRVKSNPFKLSGVRKFKEFDIKGALADFQKGLEFNEKDISLHFNIACCYSMLENADKGFEHLSKAVELGFDDFEKIKTHDALAFLRIQPQWEEFAENGFSFQKKIESPKEGLLEDDQLLTQLNKLAELREKGLITEEEFSIEKRKLMQ